MRSVLKSLALLFAAALLPGAAFAASFTASLDRDTMVLGEQASLSLRFEGVQPQDAPALPDIAGLQFQYVGPASSFSVINGQVSSSITYNYVVTAQREGEFTIPGMRANAGGQLLSSRPLKLVVTKASAPSAAAVNSGSELAFLKLHFPKTNVYPGECAVARLDLYLRDEVQNFGNLQVNSSPSDGFSAGKLVVLQNQRRREQVGNRVYTVIPLAIPLTAVKAGTLALGPISASVVVVLPAHGRGGDMLSQFFNQGEQHQVTLATETLTIESLPLPEENKPATFTGAVGQFDLAASVGPGTVTVGDPVTVRVQISGRGTIDALALPAQDGWHNFKVYPPNTKVENSDQFGFQGTKTFEQIISPLSTDVHEVPPLVFSFFNPEDGQYHTLTNAAVALVVKAAGATPLPQIAGGKSRPEEKPAPDLLPIKDRLGSLAKNRPPLVTQPAFLAAQGVPVLALLAAFIWRRRADSLANNPRRRRRLQVEKLVKAGIADLQKLAGENNPDEFFATLFRLLQEQLGERLDCPASAITENVVDEHALLRRAPAGTRDALREHFQLCNQARYAPVRGRSELSSVAAQFEYLIGELQKLKA